MFDQNTEKNSHKKFLQFIHENTFRKSRTKLKIFQENNKQSDKNIKN